VVPASCGTRGCRRTVWTWGIVLPRRAQNYKEAAKWYRLAAEQGSVEAACTLADLYLNGRGVAQDLVTAYAWFSIAADNAPTADVGRFARYFEILAARMDNAQIAEAERLVTEWQSRTGDLGITRASGKDNGQSPSPEARPPHTPTIPKKEAGVIPKVPNTTQSQAPSASTSPERADKHDLSKPTIRREERGFLSKFTRRQLSEQQIFERAYGILGEILLRSAEEGWSFSDVASNYYISFSKSGAGVSVSLREVQSAKDVICWIKLSEIPLLKAAGPPMFGPVPAVPQEIMLAALEIAQRLTQD
jgi:hypothetical protein